MRPILRYRFTPLGVKSSVRKEDPFIREGDAVVGFWANGKGHIKKKRMPIYYKSERLLVCAHCGRPGRNSVAHRLLRTEARYGYSELYEFAKNPLCVKCYFCAARAAIHQERMWAKEDEYLASIEKLVREYRIVINGPVRERLARATRFNERIRPPFVAASSRSFKMEKA